MSEFQEAIIAADGALINGLKNDVAELKKRRAQETLCQK